MLSWVGRARCLLCVFLFMPFNSNKLPKVTVGPPPGTETSMYKIRRAVQSTFCSGKSRAPSERNSCREAAQSNVMDSRHATHVPAFLPSQHPYDLKPGINSQLLGQYQLN